MNKKPGGFAELFSTALWGIRVCLSDPRIRRLALWPWGIGLLSAILCLSYSWSIHNEVYHRLLPASASILSYLLVPLAWLGATVGLFLISFLLSLLSVAVFGGIFQTRIAETVLRERGHVIPNPEGIHANIKDNLVSMKAQIIRLCWLLPLLCVAFVIGFVPLLFPVGLLLGAWILAVQFVDTVLDVLRVPALERLRFCLKYAWLLCGFGLILSLGAAVPFLGLFLPPAACAATARLLSDRGLLPH